MVAPATWHQPGGTSKVQLATWHHFTSRCLGQAPATKGPAAAAVCPTTCIHGNWQQQQQQQQLKPSTCAAAWHPTITTRTTADVSKSARQHRQLRKQCVVLRPYVPPMQPRGQAQPPPPHISRVCHMAATSPTRAAGRQFSPTSRPGRIGSPTAHGHTLLH